LTSLSFDLFLLRKVRRQSEFPQGFPTEGEKKAHHAVDGVGLARTSFLLTPLRILDVFF
jgi:hypothetical protein